MPRWWRHINKQLFNRRAIASGRWPVLTHLGRTTSVTYHTPLDAHPVSGGYLFVLVDGPGSDWVQNVLTAGRVRLRAGSGGRLVTSVRHWAWCSGWTMPSRRTTWR